MVGSGEEASYARLLASGGLSVLRGKSILGECRIIGSASERILERECEAFLHRRSPLDRHGPSTPAPMKFEASRAATRPRPFTSAGGVQTPLGTPRKQGNQRRTLPPRHNEPQPTDDHRFNVRPRPYGCTSNAPASHNVPPVSGRGSPRWSVSRSHIDARIQKCVEVAFEERRGEQALPSISHRRRPSSARWSRSCPQPSRYSHR